MSKVFLGGTCNNSTWRERLIPMLHIDYFNPVVKHWTEECMFEERMQRVICDYCLYVITPSMTGVYSIAEVVDDSNKRPDRTIFCVLSNDMFSDEDIYAPNIKRFTFGQMRSLNQVGEMVKNNGGRYFDSLDDVADYINREERMIKNGN